MVYLSARAVISVSWIFAAFVLYSVYIHVYYNCIITKHYWTGISGGNISEFKYECVLINLSHLWVFLGLVVHLWFWTNNNRWYI
jgi:hypothetical protein